MIIEIKRMQMLNGAIDGILSIDGVKICDTAENAAYAIPEGEYTLHIARSMKYGRNLLCIYGTSAVIRIGNGVCDVTDGSIIVGTNIVPGCLMRSAKSFDPLYQRVRKNIARGKLTVLTVYSYKTLTL